MSAAYSMHIMLLMLKEMMYHNIRMSEANY